MTDITSILWGPIQFLAIATELNKLLAGKFLLWRPCGALPLRKNRWDCSLIILLLNLTPNIVLINCCIKSVLTRVFSILLNISDIRPYSKKNLLL